MYSMVTRKWKLFGNETQEKDFIVTGGLLWWDDFLIMGCYSLVQKNDEIRLYPKDSKLDNRFAKIISMAAPVMLINLFKDQLVTFTADGFVTVFAITKYDSQNIDLLRTDTYDIRGLCIHPACIISVTMTNLKNDSASRANQGNDNTFHTHSNLLFRKNFKFFFFQKKIILNAKFPGNLSQIETLVLNVSGRILMVNKENNGNASENLVSRIFCVYCGNKLRIPRHINWLVDRLNSNSIQIWWLTNTIYAYREALYTSIYLYITLNNINRVATTTTNYNFLSFTLIVPVL